VFDWTYLDAQGNELGRSEGFPDAGDAEAWLSTSWPDLAEMGVEEVVLYDRLRDVRLYRMGLGQG